MDIVNIKFSWESISLALFYWSSEITISLSANLMIFIGFRFQTTKATEIFGQKSNKSSPKVNKTYVNRFNDGSFVNQFLCVFGKVR